MTIQIDERANYRRAYDDSNQRIYQVEWRCHGCHEWIGEEDVVWIENRKGDESIPYHVECAPEEGVKE